jgi:acyl-CoA dehydrogenase
MECLAAGRSISLPAGGMGGAKYALLATSAYARIRQQFNMSIGYFEGIQEVLGRMAGETYLMDAVRTMTAGAVDLGQEPAVASAIVKYHVTEMARHVVNDAMDVQGGKGICLGPNNYVGRSYQAMPIGITVEGANILTRCMIIFGQGVIRCHPYLLKEVQSIAETDKEKRLKDFDNALWGHLGFVVSNTVRAFTLGLTSARIVCLKKRKTRRYFQHATRFSAALALAADFGLMVLGGSLKRRESFSARFGDILSYLYMLSSVLNHDIEQGSTKENVPFVHWAAQQCLYRIQMSFSELRVNFPNRFVATLLHALIFPFGKHFAMPNDKLTREVAQLMLDPTAQREALFEGVYIGEGGNSAKLLEDVLRLVIQAEPIQKKLHQAKKAGNLDGDTLLELAVAAKKASMISQKELDLIVEAEQARLSVINVDDFAPEELSRV